VKQEQLSVTGRQLADCAPQVESVNRAQERGVVSTGLTSNVPFCVGATQIIRRDIGQLLPAHVHQDCIHRHSMQPGRKTRVAPEGGDFSKYLKKYLLS